MSEEFKQSLQSTREKIIERFIKQCKINNLKNAEYCINHFNITKEEIGKNCDNVLWYAARYNNIKMVSLLLKHGINPEQCIDALNLASNHNKIDVIKLLLAHCIKPEQCTKALKYAEEYNYKEIITLLENYINKDKFVIVNEQVNAKSEQEIIKQLFTLSKQLKDHSMTITIINKE